MRQLKITKSITNRESASLDKYLQEIGREDLDYSRRRSRIGTGYQKRRPESIGKIDQSEPAFCRVL